MPEEQQPQDQPTLQSKAVEVEGTKIVKGTVQIGPKAWFKPTPSLLARCTDALRYFTTFLIGTVSGSDVYTGAESKKINFGLAVFIGFLGGVDRFTGVDPDKKKFQGTVIMIGIFCAWMWFR